MTTTEVRKITSENDEERKMKIEKLRKLIEGVGHLKKILTSDIYLLRFLHSAEFDVDVAFQRMKGYHEHITESPEFYPKYGPLEIKPLVERRISTVLPDCDREGRPIIIFKPVNINTRDTKLVDLCGIDDNWFEYLLLENIEIAERGICYILDVKDVGYGFIRWFNLPNMKASIKKVAHLPFREFFIHVINKSFPIQAMTKIAIPLMPEKSRKNVKFHFTNWESLYKYVDPQYLPPEYGGTKEIDYSKIHQKLFERHEDIVRNFKLAKRVEKVK